MKKYFLILTVFSLLVSCAGPQRFWGNRSIASQSQQTKSAYDLWSELQMSGLDFVARPIHVDGVDDVPGTRAGVTFGAEKEASSSLLTRVMSPPSDAFEGMIESLPVDQREVFLRDFLSGWSKNRNGYRTFKNAEGKIVDLASDVVDLQGNPKRIDLTIFAGVNFETASLEELDNIFKKWLEQTDGRAFSFIKPTLRRKLFLGKFSGLNKDLAKRYIGKNSYRTWMPIFGMPEKYIDSAHVHNGGTAGGWEINFKPMDTYGEFEGLISWFKTSLSTRDARGAVKLFEAPGHQRMVFSKHPKLNEKKLAEIFKMIQALIVVDGVKGGTGIEVAHYKSVHPDSIINSLHSQRGAIRLEGSRHFGGSQSWNHTYSIEFRAGTKDPKVQQFIEMALAARVGANDFSGLANSHSWTLVEGLDLSWGMSDKTKKYAKRFGVEENIVEKAFEVIKASGISGDYIVPLWYWTNSKNPFIKKSKRKLLKDMTKDFLVQLATVDPSNAELAKQVVRKKMKYWVRGANLDMDIRHYLMPWKKVKTSSNLDKFIVREGAAIDVNKIDVGIEYSGKFPIKTMTFSRAPSTDAFFRLPNGRVPWVATVVDLSDQERKKVVHDVAKSLRKELGGGSEVVFDDADGHGHGIDVAYEFRDKQNRKWRVEWDGISRAYDSNGHLVEGSARGGSIELVTPKFVPKIEEMKAVFAAFKANNITPFIKAGGGHINIDLAAFAGKPHAMARFLALFLENRGIISLMYQHNLRLKAGEPIHISSHLVEELKNFNGTEDELKKLLYNERYFNTRLGRKTRYTQLDLSAYFQDVIPEEFITEDFDILNADVPWRKQFRVDPRIRKAEFRLFDAPVDAADSALQLKLVRALLNKALNDDTPLSGTVQKVDHEGYLKNISKAEHDLEIFCREMGLDIDEYRPALAKGLAETKSSLLSKFYKPLSERLKPFPHISEWGSAVEPRDEAHAISSEGRVWNPDDPGQMRLGNEGQRIPESVRSAEMNERIRAEGLDAGLPQGHFYRESCVGAATQFFRGM